MSQEQNYLDCIKVKDFKSASTAVKMIGTENIFSIDIYLANVEILYPKKISAEVIEDIRKLFLNRIEYTEIIMNDNATLKFHNHIDEIVLTDEPEIIEQIHKISDYMNNIHVIETNLYIAIFLNPSRNT